MAYPIASGLLIFWSMAGGFRIHLLWCLWKIICERKLLSCLFEGIYYGGFYYPSFSLFDLIMRFIIPWWFTNAKLLSCRILLCDAFCFHCLPKASDFFPSHMSMGIAINSFLYCRYVEILNQHLWSVVTFASARCTANVMASGSP